ncbi:MAG: hypothetical protein EBT82_04645 [Micrococcales bacterium]|nr:hypothetical protein [Micrococcales bacterium]NBR62320.1 hypothetical protein [Actinomycetota bacterium]NBR55237.1 hypothetical protein [Micrococcales bacterium]NBT48130.1 hypothetical protein [Actinomycetota bacterium]NBY44257.1 hypothetical protein [Micrococcales bacterium]
MRKAALFIAGIAVGVYLARQIESNPEAKKAIEDAGAKAKTFATAFSAGFREQELKNSKRSVKK